MDDGSVNMSDWNDTTNFSEGFLLEVAPVFDEYALVKTVVLVIVAVLSLIGNIATLINIHRTQRRTVSTMYMLITQLTVADLLVTLFCVTAEAVWTYTVQWLAGDALCKIVKYMQMFSLYLSTFILVLIGVDRYIAVRYPMNRSNAHRRCNILITLAWIVSALLSIPQVIIFRVRRAPFEEEFYQCVTHGYYTTEWEEQLYATSSLVIMFILPLLTIITTYICTFCTIANQGNEQIFRRDDSLIQTDVVRQRLFRKAKMKSLQITIVIVLAFVICWTPYYTLMITYLFLQPDDQLSEELKAGIFFFGMSNSMVNPLIYGAFHLRKRDRLRHSSRNVSQSTISFRKRSHYVGRGAVDDRTVTVVEDMETLPLKDTNKFHLTRKYYVTSGCDLNGKAGASLAVTSI